jgi:hypothetical protein
MSKRGKCGNCLHWAALPGQRDMRFCTKNPPQVVLIPRQSALQPGQMNLSAEGTWPPVGPDTGCGCFEQADDDVIATRTIEREEAMKRMEGSKIVSMDRDKK